MYNVELINGIDPLLIVEAVSSLQISLFEYL